MKKQKQLFITLFLIILSLFNIANGQRLFINEFLASNVITNAEILDYDDYSDWVEIYNDETTAVDLGGYFLTDDLNNPTKHQIPAGTIINGKSYLLFWADGMQDQNVPGLVNLHLSFKLSQGGEEIGIFDPTGKLIDLIKFGIQITDVSFGRRLDDASIWNYYGEPTPGKENITEGTLNTERASKPLFSVPGGVYQIGKKVTLSNESPSAIIRYTKDGSKPSNSSNEYTSWISLEHTTVLRARVFDGDKLPGPITTQSYIIAENPTLPVLSLAVFPEPMFGDEKGIYTNEIKRRVLPVSVEYFNKEGGLNFSLDAGVRISGQAAWEFAQKPLTISTEDRFGFDEMNYKIFPSRENEKFKSVYLRNSGYPDFYYTMFRDGLQHSIVINQFDLDLQAYQPAMTFINGEYYGIYNIREKLDADYIASHHNIDPTNIDYLEYDFSETPVEIEGNADDYNKLLKYLRENDLERTITYNYVKSQIDVNEYINYMITQIFCNNQNYLYTNVRWWREKVENTKWRWVMLDLDYGFGMVDNFEHNAIEMATNPEGEREEFDTFLFRTLITNQDFREEFIQRFAVYLNTVFHKDRVLHIVDSLKSNIDQEIPRHINKWDPAIPDLSTWEHHVQVMRDFALNRPQHQWQHLTDFFGLADTAIFTVKRSELEGGKVLVNTYPVPKNYSAPHFKNVPIRLKALPAVGYRFVKWQGISNDLSDSISVILTDSSGITAVFEESGESILPSLVESDTTLTLSGSPYLAKGDVIIAEGSEVILEEGVEIIMPDKANIIVNGKLDINGSAANPVTIKPNKNSGFSNWGVLIYENTAAPSTVSHLIIEGATIGKNREKHIGAISVNNSTVTLNNLFIQDALFPVFAENSNIEIRNSNFHCKYTSDLINVKNSASALVENCILRGNLSADTDAIDFDGVTDGIIRNNTIYNFFGFNSDGIDLGEQAKNILIEDNLIFNCSDKGISVGQASTTIIKNNVIVNCAQGVGVKDDLSYAYIDQNTFYGNQLGVASFEKNFGAGGGKVNVINSIISNSTTAPLFVDELSNLDISYSLSDTDLLVGTENLNADPLFVNNFYLNQNSPAINTGSPASPTDPDGSVSDMGAHYHDGQEHDKIIINEIHFNPANGDDYEFIELYNSGNSPIDISGFKLTGAIDFTFPSGVTIFQNEFIVVAKNPTAYADSDYQVFGWSERTLPDTESDIRLLSEAGDIVDFVSYGDNNGWVNTSNGSGPSLELRSTQLENLLYSNWRISYVDGGTPGRKNSIQIIENLYINEIMAKNTNGYTDEQNDFEDWIEIYNGSSRSIDIGGLYLTDNFDNPTLYRIPTFDQQKTTIKPGGVLVLWADNEPDQGMLHLNFRLNNAGEELAIVRVIENDTIFVDHMEFDAQEDDVSFARKPDGGENWYTIYKPTPNLLNHRTGLFQKGILVVNNTKSLDDLEVYAAFANNAFWGDHPISFWDAYDKPKTGYPPSLPFKPTGRGSVSFDQLIKYSAVIWLGNDFYDNSESLFKYVDYGGNLILLSRFGHLVFEDKISELTGINWDESGIVKTTNCISIYDGLQDISLIADQSGSEVFDVNIDNENSTLLFVENISSSESRGLGVWHKPDYGGFYKSGGGQTVLISGIPYRYDYDELSTNIEYILKHFFNDKVLAISESDIDEPVDSYELSQNYPNPFNPATTIKYALKKAGSVELIVYDLLGRRVKTLVDKRQKAGRYEVLFNASNLSTGLYFYKIKTGSYEKTRKMVLIK